MTDDGSVQNSNNAVWPMPKFYFEVKWDSDVINFQEVSGLEQESEPVEYRSGDSRMASVLKMPGLKKHGNITMKKGVFVNDNKFWDWFNAIKLNTVSRVSLTISLLDETGKQAMVWTVANAWPTKITGTDLTAEGNEVSVESIEIAHEGVTIV